MNKRRKIKEQLETTEKCVANADEYVAQNVNVEGSAWLHTDDWKGKSGHPLWMKNYMMPAIKKSLIRKEKALEKIKNKSREKLKQRSKRS